MSLKSPLNSSNNDVPPSNKKKVSFKEETPEDSTRKSPGKKSLRRLYTNINDTSAPVTTQKKSVNFLQDSDETEVINDNDVTSTPADKRSEQSETDIEKYVTGASMIHSHPRESYLQYRDHSCNVTANIDNSVPTQPHRVHHSSYHDGSRLVDDGFSAFPRNVTNHYQMNPTKRNDAYVSPVTDRPDKSFKKLEKILLKLEERQKNIIMYIIVFFLATFAYEMTFFVLISKNIK